jgi:hypothetical protein
MFPLLWLAAALAAGCGNVIGDACTSNAECAFGHQCDTSSPAGYCLLTNCRANSCPQEAWCAVFQISTSRTQSFCLRKCKDDGDCRDGYRCRFDLGTPGGVCYVPPAG